MRIAKVLEIRQFKKINKLKSIMIPDSSNNRSEDVNKRDKVNLNL